MEEIARRSKAKDMIAQMHELLDSGLYEAALALAKQGLKLGDVGPVHRREMTDIRDKIEPILQRWKEADDKAKAKAEKRAHKPTIKLNPAAERLGLEGSCRDWDMIKKAYRKESLRHHPDRNKGDETEAARRFMLANEAYDALKTALEDATDGAIAELNRQYDADVAKSAFKDMLRTEDIEAWHAFDYVKDHCCELEGWKEAKMGDRRQAFAEYLGERVKGDKEAERQVGLKKKRKQQQAFISLVAETEAITAKTSWPAASRILQPKQDPRYLDIDENERCEYFRDFAELLEKTEADEKKAKQRKKRAAFRDLLGEIEPAKFFKASGLDDDADAAKKWGKVRYSKVEDKVLRPLSDKRFKALSSEDRRYEFDKFADEMAAEAQMAKDERRREKDEERLKADEARRASEARPVKEEKRQVKEEKRPVKEEKRPVKAERDDKPPAKKPKVEELEAGEEVELD